MSNSFYGGREGRSFIIVKEFKTIAEMVEKFKLGPSYSEVNFDEYVLINTINKSNPENGQIFRRGYDFNSNRKIKTYNIAEIEEDNEIDTYLNLEVPAGGAVYVGTIVGPAGKAPRFEFGQYQDVIDATQIAVFTATDDYNLTTIDSMLQYLTSLYPSGDAAMDANNNLIINTESITEENPRTQCVKIIRSVDGKNYFYYFYFDNFLYKPNTESSIGWYSIDTPPKTGIDSYSPQEGLVPGVQYKTNSDGTLYYQVDSSGRRHLVPIEYQDTIDWSYCSIRNENNEDSTAYVGFKFGTPVVEYEAETVDAYYNRSDTITGSTVKTNNFNNLNLIEKVEEYLDGSSIEDHPFYSKWALKIPKGIKGESIKNIYLMDASQSHNIKQFKLDENGNLQYDATTGAIQVQDYSESGDLTQDKMVIVYDYVCYDRMPEGEQYTIYLGDFNQIEDISFDSAGTVVLDYTHDDTKTYANLIKWITDMKFDDTGTVAITFNNNQIANGKLTYTNLISWITDMTFDDTGTVTVTFNNNQVSNGKLTRTNLINWITNFTLDEDTGALKVTFNNSNIAAIDKTLQWVKDISIGEDGTITTDYTNIANKVESSKLNWIKTASFNSDTGALSITFNNNNISDISHTLNYIKSVERDEYNHLLITHSDPTKGTQDLGGIGYIMSHADDNSIELVNQQNALSPGGVWIITKEV